MTSAAPGDEPGRRAHRSEGDRFRFVTLRGGATGSDPEQTPAIVIYGDVVR